MALLKSKAAIKEGRPHMKLNLKSTIAAPAGHKSLNGIIGNTRRGIVVDQTLDPDSNNPVANKPVSTALAALAGKIDAALQSPTGLTKTKLVGVGSSGQENIEIGDNLTLTDGKLAAAGGSVSPTLNLIDFENGEIRTSITEEEYNNLKNGLYNSVNYCTELPAEVYLQSKLASSYDDSDKSLYCSFSSIKVTATSETDISSTNIIYQLNIGQKDTSGNYPITIEKAIEIPFGSSSSGSGGGLVKIRCVRKDYQDLTKGGTVDTSTLPTDVPFILEVGMDGEQSGDIAYYGKLEFLMCYYSYNDHSGASKKT